MRNETKEKPTRAVVAAVQLSGVSDIEFELSVNELRGLGKTLGFEVVGTFTAGDAPLRRRQTRTEFFLRAR
jgi:GTPase